MIRARPLRPQTKEVLSWISGQSEVPRSQWHPLAAQADSENLSMSWHSSRVGTSRKLSSTPPTEGPYGQMQHADSAAILQVYALQLVCSVKPKEAAITRSTGASLGVLVPCSH